MEKAKLVQQTLFLAKPIWRTTFVNDESS